MLYAMRGEWVLHDASISICLTLPRQEAQVNPLDIFFFLSQLCRFEMH
jgi:hypothetical protein